MASILPAIRQAAPKLARQLFQCSRHRCHGSTGLRSALLLPKASPSYIRTFKSSPPRLSEATSSDVASKPKSSSPLSSLSMSILAKRQRGKARFFPETSEKLVAYWLLGSAASVFGIVVFGGLTRLTESGYCSPSPCS